MGRAVGSAARSISPAWFRKTSPPPEKIPVLHHAGFGYDNAELALNSSRLAKNTSPRVQNLVHDRHVKSRSPQHNKQNIHPDSVPNLAQKIRAKKVSAANDLSHPHVKPVKLPLAPEFHGESTNYPSEGRMSRHENIPSEFRIASTQKVSTPLMAEKLVFPSNASIPYNNFKKQDANDFTQNRPQKGKDYNPELYTNSSSLDENEFCILGEDSLQRQTNHLDQSEFVVIGDDPAEKSKALREHEELMEVLVTAFQKKSSDYAKQSSIFAKVIFRQTNPELDAAIWLYSCKRIPGLNHIVNLRANNQTKPMPTQNFKAMTRSSTEPKQTIRFHNDKLQFKFKPAIDACNKIFASTDMASYEKQINKSNIDILSHMALLIYEGVKEPFEKLSQGAESDPSLMNLLSYIKKPLAEMGLIVETTVKYLLFECIDWIDNESLHFVASFNLAPIKKETEIKFKYKNLEIKLEQNNWVRFVKLIWSKMVECWPDSRGFLSVALLIGFSKFSQMIFQLCLPIESVRMHIANIGGLLPGMFSSAIHQLINEPSLFKDYFNKNEAIIMREIFQVNLK
jgi:hypothetical protein